MPTKVEISHRTIIFTIFFLILLWILVLIKEIIFLVFVAFILMSALKPLADSLHKFHIPKAISVLIVYICFIALMVFIISSMLPPLIAQSSRLIENLPEYVTNVIPFANIDAQMLIQQVAPIGENLLKFSLGIFNNIITFVTVFVVSFYMVLERSRLESHLSSFMGEDRSRGLMVIFSHVEDRLGAWVRGQVTLMLTIGIFTFIGLTVLRIPYVLPLSIFAGLLEIIPTIGPIVSGIPAVLIGFTISPFMALISAVLYFVIQQAENHLIVPFVMKKALGLPPLVTILALLIGGKLAGIIGAILAVPIVLTIETIVAEVLKGRQQQDI